MYSLHIYTQDNLVLEILNMHFIEDRISRCLLIFCHWVAVSLTKPLHLISYIKETGKSDCHGY